MSFEDVLVNHLLPMFRDARDDMHPWWWPRGSGGATADWFGELSPEQITAASGLPVAALLESLRGGREPVVRADYDGFMGAFGFQRLATSGKVVVLLSDRPSIGEFPAGVVTTLVRALNEVGLVGVHVTDMIRRRGLGSSHLLPLDEALRPHIDCLRAELEWLSALEGTGVLVVPVRQHTAQLIEHVGWQDVVRGVDGVRQSQRVLPFWSRGGRGEFVDGLWDLINDPE